MAVAGSVEIVGSINIESIKHGLKEMKLGLDQAQAAAKSAFGDLKRTGETVGKIADPLAKIGVALGTTMLGIAALSPAVAPVIARMQVQFLKLSRIIGEQLKPVFEEAEESFAGFVNWLDSSEGRGAIESFGNALIVVKDAAAMAAAQMGVLAAASRGVIDPVVGALGGIRTREEQEAGAE